MTTIELDKLACRRGSTVLFKNLSYRFAPHQITLLYGASGCGKSSLLKLIAGFSQLEFEGTILLDEIPQRPQPPYVRAREVGFVFQNPNQQFTMKTLRRECIFALENSQFPAARISAQITETARLLMTTHLLDRPFARLSGGEKQQAALTVVMALDPPLLLLDEPFASLDPHARKHFIKLLARLRDQGKTILLCDHDLADYQGLIDSVVLLEAGNLAPVSLKILEQPAERPALKNSKSLKIPRLQLENIGINHRQQELLTIPEKTFYRGITTLTGANGVGKSTLLRAIVQQQKYSGRMFWDGQKIRRSKNLYRWLSLAVQDANRQFVSLTPQQELAFGVKKSENCQIQQQMAVDFLGLSDKLNDSLFQLSEGQKKMIQLISLLSLDLSCLLLDEPFSGLDEKACTFFMEWIQSKAHQQDFLIVSHRLAPLAGYSQHHFEIAGGQVHER